MLSFFSWFLIDSNALNLEKYINFTLILKLVYDSRQQFSELHCFYIQAVFFQETLSSSLNKDRCTCTCIYLRLITGRKISFKSVLEKKKINIEVYRNTDLPLCQNSKKIVISDVIYTASKCKEIRLITNAFFFNFPFIVRGLMVGRKGTCMWRLNSSCITIPYMYVNTFLLLWVLDMYI